jgi:hypothetical protein
MEQWALKSGRVRHWTVGPPERKSAALDSGPSTCDARPPTPLGWLKLANGLPWQELKEHACLAAWLKLEPRALYAHAQTKQGLHVLDAPYAQTKHKLQA